MKHSAQKGTVIVEFAIVFPIMLMLVLGVIQISFMFVARTVVEYAAFAAARAELVGEDPARAAQFVCSTISGPSYTPGTGRPIVVPGWGVLPRSESSSLKTTADVIEGFGDRTGTVTVEVTHLYELVVPVIPLLLKPVANPIQPGEDIDGLFVTVNGSPHLAIRARYTRPVPWDEELKEAQGHPIIPNL